MPIRPGDASTHFSAAINARILQGLDETLVLDPACGCGAFLIEMWRLKYQLFSYLQRTCISESRQTQLVPSIDGFLGWDVQPLAVAVSRLRLLLEQASIRGRQDDAEQAVNILLRNIECDDALLRAPPTEAPHVIVGNPPFMSARRISSTYGRDYKQQLAARFESTRGPYDLSGLFVELSLARLAHRGALALVLPNKFSRIRLCSPITGTPGIGNNRRRDH